MVKTLNFKVICKLLVFIFTMIGMFSVVTHITNNYYIAFAFQIMFSYFCIVALREK